MNGYASRYLFYESNKQSIVIIPRSIIEVTNLNWQHRDSIYIVYRTVDWQEGLFLCKKPKSQKEELSCKIDEFGDPIIPYGYTSKYLHYKANNQSQITIPRPIIEGINLNWHHKDIVNIEIKVIDGQKGLFLFKLKSKS